MGRWGVLESVSNGWRDWWLGGRAQGVPRWCVNPCHWGGSVPASVVARQRLQQLSIRNNLPSTSPPSRWITHCRTAR